MFSYLFASIFLTFVSHLISDELPIGSKHSPADQVETSVADLKIHRSQVRNKLYTFAENENCQLICDQAENTVLCGGKCNCTWLPTKSVCSAVTRETLRSAEVTDIVCKNLISINDSVKRLSISHPSISTLQVGFLRDFKDLATFECLNARLEVIEDGTFHGAFHKTFLSLVLNLSGNHLTSI